MHISDMFPEWDIKGDPFIDELVKADDCIDDLLYNYEWLDLPEVEARVQARELEQWRDGFEIGLLERWLEL